MFNLFCDVALPPPVIEPIEIISELYVPLLIVGLTAIVAVILAFVISSRKRKKRNRNDNPDIS